MPFSISLKSAKFIASCKLLQEGRRFRRTQNGLQYGFCAFCVTGAHGGCRLAQGVAPIPAQQRQKLLPLGGRQKLCGFGHRKTGILLHFDCLLSGLLL